MDKEQRAMTGSLEVRKAEGEPTKIIGYAVRWGQLSNPLGWFQDFQEKFERGAFTKALAEKRDQIYAAWNHDSGQILGRSPSTLKLEEDEIGLRYEIDPPSWADKYVESIERGDVRGSSFIFRPVNQQWDESNPDMAIRSILEADLFEVSPVTTPAYPTSSVGVRSVEEVYKEFQETRQSAKDMAADEKRALQQKQRQRELDLIGREM